MTSLLLDRDTATPTKADAGAFNIQNQKPTLGLNGPNRARKYAETTYVRMAAIAIATSARRRLAGAKKKVAITKPLYAPNAPSTLESNRASFTFCRDPMEVVGVESIKFGSIKYCRSESKQYSPAQSAAKAKDEGDRSLLPFALIRRMLQRMTSGTDAKAMAENRAISGQGLK